MAKTNNKRYLLLIGKLKQKRYPTKQQLLDFLQENDEKISGRTLDRDINTIRYELNTVIQYDISKRGYFIDDDSSLNTDNLVQYLQLFVLGEMLGSDSNAFEHIQFESSLTSYKGINYIKDLLFALSNHQVITISYQKHQEDVAKEHKLHPYLLKEYEKQWYLIAQPAKGGRLKYFGIDRIKDMVTTNKTFKPKKKLKPRDEFDDIIGIWNPQNEKKEKFVLSFNPTQGNYIKSSPIHPSQDIEFENGDETRISLVVKPNPELYQHILKWLPDVKVIEPAWLVDEMKGILNKSLDMYKT
jgi:predicted DNA-binding transcriptional regulator YafY